MESEQFRWIGKSLPRVEDERLMRGVGRYIDDLEPFPGCAVAAIVRSPYAHAYIQYIDVQAASQIRRTHSCGVRSSASGHGYRSLDPTRECNFA